MAGTTYVALGDSYSAGTGAGDRTDTCFRSAAAYPALVARRLGASLAFQACERAVVSDVRAHQLGALDADTRVVTLTVGGNDAGFGPVLTRAAAPAWLADADDAIAGARRIVAEVLPDLLTGLYTEIRERAPSAEVLVVGYPRLFAGEDCDLLTFFSPEEMTALNTVADELATTIEAAATRTGCGFADVREVFTGHALCAEHPFLHGLTWPVTESFHPNRAGQEAYADTVAPLLGVPVAEGALASGPPPPVVPGPCVRGSATPFGMPALTTPEALARAADHGLDPELVRTLALAAGRTDRPPADPARRAAAEGLAALDSEVRHRRR